MVYPKFLKENDLISVPAPSDGANNEQDINRYKNAVEKLEKLGYKIKLSKNIFNSKMARSADAKTRAEEINEMFQDESSLILCAAGGEFLVEILPYVKFEEIIKNPKWIEGFSDPTGILFPLTTKYDIATIYGTNFKSFGMKEYHKSLNDNLEILKGNLIEQESYNLYENERIEKITGLEGYNLTEKVEWKAINNEEINVTGRIIAGCFDLIIELAGTKYDGVKEFNERYKQDGIIWCFDNCEYSKEELIRSLWKLNELEYFKYTKAIIFGRNGRDISYLEYDMENTIKDSVISKLNIPIIYDADISHKAPSMTIINGSVANVQLKDGKGKIKFEFK